MFQDFLPNLRWKRSHCVQPCIRASFKTEKALMHLKISANFLCPSHCCCCQRSSLILLVNTLKALKQKRLWCTQWVLQTYQVTLVIVATDVAANDHLLFSGGQRSGQHFESSKTEKGLMHLITSANFSCYYCSCCQRSSLNLRRVTVQVNTLKVLRQMRLSHPLEIFGKLCLSPLQAIL